VPLPAASSRLNVLTRSRTCSARGTTHYNALPSCGTLKRHNAVFKGPITANLNKQGYNFDIEHTILDDAGKKAGDAYVTNPYVDEPKTILDVTTSCPTCPSYICNAAAATNDHCTKLAEKNKHTKYDDLASKLDCRVVAAAFTTYGGWGDDLKKTLVDPYYKKEFKAARAMMASQAGRLSMTGSAATSATSWQSSAARIHACSARRSTPAAEPGQSNALHCSGLRYQMTVMPTPKQGQGRCFFCVCCVLVRCVWVFAVRESLGSCKIRKKKKKSPPHADFSSFTNTRPPPCFKDTLSTHGPRSTYSSPPHPFKPLSQNKMGPNADRLPVTTKVTP